ncbi:MAG: hypothetical protein OHK0022_36800 [Roseiflexaceae bacterium]
MPDQPPSAPDQNGPGQNGPDKPARDQNSPDQPARDQNARDKRSREQRSAKPDAPSNDQPATPPSRRFRPPGRRRRSAIQPPIPPRRPPQLGTLSMEIRLNGPEQDSIRMIKYLSQELPVILCVEAFVTLPDEVWSQFPERFLNRSERNIVREDLRLNSTNEVSRILHMTTRTINYYRSNIRSQFLSIPPEQRPAWMDAWLRRYPGVRPDPAGPPEGSDPTPGDAPTEEGAA